MSNFTGTDGISTFMDGHDCAECNQLERKNKQLRATIAEKDAEIERLTEAEADARGYARDMSRCVEQLEAELTRLRALCGRAKGCKFSERAALMAEFEQAAKGEG